MKLNLQATTKEEQKVKAYLEANASEVLAEKINNGVRIQKDGKTLINKKTLAGFLKFACGEAKKQAEKGAQSACIDDETVYGWAVHYFEEASIEGTLYNEDGTEYQAPMPKTKPMQTKPTPPMPKPKPQLSIFDMVSVNQLADEENEEPDDEPTDEDDTEAAEQLAEEEKAKPPERTVSPMYQKYLDVQEKYPHAVVAIRLGDFYEVFGKNAEVLASELPLTLTGRDCGLESRVPMVGFPYHTAEMYFGKILSNGHTLVVMENDDEVRELPAEQTVDLETGEILSEEEMREFDGDVEESIPTVSGLLKNYDGQPKTDERLAEDISAVIDEDDFALSAFDAEAVAILSELFGDEIELR